MSDLKGWRDTSNIIAALAVILSLVSLVVSLRSCQVADKSLGLAVTEFKSQRALILGGAVSDGGQAIELKTVDPNVALQEARVFFPSAISNEEWPVLPPDYKLHVMSPRFALQGILEKYVGRKPGYVKVALDANVPIVISSLYTAKGEAFHEQSLYRIMYSFVISDEENKPPTVDFKGLVYIQRLGVKEDPREVLDKVWKQATLK